jgi:glycerophosphoryl diester phosphodiesterase
MDASFDFQGHRGARGLKPENTFPSFEVAFDLGVTAIETDVHLTRDGVPVLVHDAAVTERIFELIEGKPEPLPDAKLLVSSLCMEQLRSYRANRNPDPGRFPRQTREVTPLAALYSSQKNLDPYTPPTLADLFAFAEGYAGDLGRQAGKTPAQQARARGVRFDLELKRVPFHPAVIGDDFDGVNAGLLERAVVEAVRSAGVLSRAIVRSFDHRSVRAVKRLEPQLTTAVLVTGTAPVAVAPLARAALAEIYCPDYLFLDANQVREAHAEGIRVVPWTVNDPGDCVRLLDWGVDGITTDFPDRLAPIISSSDRLPPRRT